MNLKDAERIILLENEVVRLAKRVKVLEDREDIVTEKLGVDWEEEQKKIDQKKKDEDD